MLISFAISALNGDPVQMFLSLMAMPLIEDKYISDVLSNSKVLYDSEVFELANTVKNRLIG